MPKPKVTSLFLKRAVRDLERLKGQAEKHGDDVSLLAYLINMALVEVRERPVFGTPDPAAAIPFSEGIAGEGAKVFAVAAEGRKRCRWPPN